jgi:hypothetical protein
LTYSSGHFDGDIIMIQLYLALGSDQNRMLLFGPSSGTYPEGGSLPSSSLKNVKAWREVQVDQVLPAEKQFFYMAIPLSPP